jgi:putative ABC transport system permease protein
LFLALREMRRARGRFVLLAGAIGLLVVLLLFFQSVAATLTAALTGAIANQTGEVLVYDDQARRNPSASVLRDDTVTEIAGVDRVGAAVAVHQTFATVSGPGGQAEAVLVGLDLGGPGTPAAVTEGRLPRADGEALASGSGFEAPYPIGSQVEVVPDGPSLRVVGLADGAAFNASPTLYMATATWQDAVRQRTGAAGALPPSYAAVAPADGSTPDDVVAAIDAQVANVDAVDRATAATALPGVETIEQSFGILYGLLYVVVAIVTGVFFLILTVQKRDALVLLRAVGARRRDVVAPVLIQVVTVIAAGVLIGVAATAGLLTAARETFGSSLTASTTTVSAGVLLALGLLAAAGAVRRVLSIEPVEATQHGGIG